MAKDALGLVKEDKGGRLLQIRFKYVGDVLRIFAAMWPVTMRMVNIRWC